MVSGKSQGANFYTASYKKNKKRKLKNHKGKGFLPLFLTYFQKEGRNFLLFKALISQKRK